MEAYGPAPTTEVLDNAVQSVLASMLYSGNLNVTEMRHEIKKRFQMRLSSCALWYSMLRTIQQQQREIQMYQMQESAYGWMRYHYEQQMLINDEKVVQDDLPPPPPAYQSPTLTQKKFVYRIDVASDPSERLCEPAGKQDKLRQGSGPGTVIQAPAADDEVIWKGALHNDDNSNTIMLMTWASIVSNGQATSFGAKEKKKDKRVIQREISSPDDFSEYL